ncbi:Hypothetical predicted protein [Paramuricea clavata]|uniref:Uncharacterized protein n=1 Tax=Paramuricea clavata TaxID=317549 RepID=A0A6S7H802_PARCT|nr:Hypothetical predicted protein [Paramuricea clavata]
MGYFTFTFLICLVVILPSFPCQGAIRPFWWKPINKPEPTLLPPIGKDPEFYRKLQKEIPPKNETAKKLITNILRIRPGGKRMMKLQDFVIVMDGSSSIRQCEFNNGKKAMQSLLQYTQPGVDAKYAMVTFASSVRRDFNFLSQSDAAAKISSVTFPRGYTNTQGGLAEAFNLFKTEGRRNFGTRKVVLLLTDGQSNILPHKTIPNAKALKDAGVEVFVVAVGNEYISGINEMAHIAKFPPAKFLFRVRKFGSFLDVVKLAIKEVAPDVYEIVKKYKSTCS